MEFKLSKQDANTVVKAIDWVEDVFGAPFSGVSCLLVTPCGTSTAQVATDLRRLIQGERSLMGGHVGWADLSKVMRYGVEVKSPITECKVFASVVVPSDDDTTRSFARSACIPGGAIYMWCNGEWTVEVVPYPGKKAQRIAHAMGRAETAEIRLGDAREKITQVEGWLEQEVRKTAAIISAAKSVLAAHLAHG